MEDSLWENIETDMASSGEAQIPLVNSGSLNSSTESPCSIEDSFEVVKGHGALTSSPQQSTLQSWVVNPCGKMTSSVGSDASLNTGLQKLQYRAASTHKLAYEQSLLVKRNTTGARKICDDGLSDPTEKHDKQIQTVS